MARRKRLPNRSILAHPMDVGGDTVRRQGVAGDCASLARRMRVRVLGHAPYASITIDGQLLVGAGDIDGPSGSWRNEIFVILLDGRYESVRELPKLASHDRNVTVIASQSTLKLVRTHLFNGDVAPKNVVRYKALSQRKCVVVGKHEVTLLWEDGKNGAGVLVEDRKANVRTLVHKENDYLKKSRSSSKQIRQARALPAADLAFKILDDQTQVYPKAVQVNVAAGGVFGDAIQVLPGDEFLI